MTTGMRALLAAIALLTGWVSTVYADSTYFITESTISHDSNLGHAEHAPDKQEDAALALAVSANHSMLLSPNSGLIISLNAGLKEQAHYEDLSHLQFGFSSRYKVQPVAGFTSPWLELAIGADRLHHRDSDIRDGWIGDASATIGKHFTDKLQMGATYVIQHRHASKGGVFDLDNQQIGLSAEYKPVRKLTIYGSMRRIFGDQVSVASLPPIGVSLANSAEAISDDPALEVNGVSRRAYRIDAVTDNFELGFNYALASGLALDASVLQFSSNADGGHHYEGFSARAGLLYKF